MQAKSASIDSFNENLTKRNKLERRSTKRNKLERRSCDAAIQGNFKIGNFCMKYYLNN